MQLLRSRQTNLFKNHGHPGLKGQKSTSQKSKDVRQRTDHRLGTRCNATLRRALQSALESIMSLTTILLIILILVLVGALPSWPHSRSWGYAPSIAISLLVVVVVVLLLTGRA